ncbi:pyridoxal phosphate homeostasis protein-like [Amphiura filiformis]|uniref:pyridoxal phosphate homeostasis protein-like n=1 Tax=Amphiura filiformis TaxID=82378 RepID=UPI003B2119C1
MFSRLIFFQRFGMATQVDIDVGKALNSVLTRAQKACAERSPDLPQVAPRVVAVSKTKPVGMIKEAYECGQRHFGENYVQELVDKSADADFMSSCKEIRWHFIGHLQTNKVKKVLGASNLYMVETIDSKKLANEVNKQWEKLGNGERLKVMVQVNTSGEENKHGIAPSECVSLVDHVRTQCPHLELAGIMTIGAFDHDLSQGPNPDFKVLLKCREDVCSKFNLSKDSMELSMGMSGDFEHAISAGSTNVRIGSTIFGARNYTTKPSGATKQSNTQNVSSSSQQAEQNSDSLDNLKAVSDRMSDLKVEVK